MSSLKATNLRFSDLFCSAELRICGAGDKDWRAIGAVICSAQNTEMNCACPAAFGKPANFPLPPDVLSR